MRDRSTRLSDLKETHIRMPDARLLIPLALDDVDSVEELHHLEESRKHVLELKILLQLLFGIGIRLFPQLLGVERTIPRFKRELRTTIESESGFREFL